jgi:Predicted P-loop-containing kinase
MNDSDSAGSADRRATHPHIVLVTGQAGAGRSTALNVLEDAGYEAIDNLPLRLMPALLAAPARSSPMALGIDPRNRDFSLDAMMDLLRQLAAAPDLTSELLYLDCSTEVLLQRFSETRRRHPLAPVDQPEEGIRRERDLLAPIRNRADVLIDTTSYSVRRLREDIESGSSPVASTTLRFRCSHSPTSAACRAGSILSMTAVSCVIPTMKNSSRR